MFDVYLRIVVVLALSFLVAMNLFISGYLSAKIAVNKRVFPDHGGKAQNAIFSFP